jgi:urease accessory protein
MTRAEQPRGWMGEVAVAVVADEFGRTAYPTLRSAGAVAVRVAGDEAYIVGAGAHPIGGDRVRIGIDVGCKARLTVRSTSATVARGAVPPRESLVAIEAKVGRGGRLTWLPEPGVAARGSLHCSSARLSIAPTARLAWSDSIVLGRVGEEPGSWTSRLRLEVGGQPLLVNELALGPAHPAWSAPSVLGGARAVTTLVMVDPDRRMPAPTVLDGILGYVIPIGANGFSAVAWGDTNLECQQSLAALRVAAHVDGWLHGDHRAMTPAA